MSRSLVVQGNAFFGFELTVQAPTAMSFWHDGRPLVTLSPARVELHGCVVMPIPVYQQLLRTGRVVLPGTKEIKIDGGAR